MIAAGPDQFCAFFVNLLAGGCSGNLPFLGNLTHPLKRHHSQVSGVAGQDLSSGPLPEQAAPQPSQLEVLGIGRVIREGSGWFLLPEIIGIPVTRQLGG